MKRYRTNNKLNTKPGSIIVSHAGRRDGYELAFSLASTGRKVHLITDFYYQPKTWLGKLSRIFFRSSVYKRYRLDLNVAYHTSSLLLVLDIAERIFPRNKVINQGGFKCEVQQAGGNNRRH